MLMVVHCAQQCCRPRLDTVRKHRMHSRKREAECSDREDRHPSSRCVNIQEEKELGTSIRPGIVESLAELILP